MSFAAGEGPWTAHRRSQVIAPSFERNQLFPAGLDMLVLQCLGKEPEQRPTDMTVVLAALRSVPAARWTTAEAVGLWMSLRTSRPRPTTTSETDPTGLSAPSPIAR